MFDDFISESAKSPENTDSGRSVISQQMILVDMDPKEEAVFRKKYIPNIGTFVPLADDIADVSARLTAYLCFLRYCLVQSYRLDSLDKDARRAVLNAEADRILNNLTNVAVVKTGAKDYLTNLASGSNHVISPSTRFKGGYDVSYLGNITASDASDTSFPTCIFYYNENQITTYSPIGVDIDSDYKTKKLEQYSTPLSLAAIATGEAIITALFGSGEALSMSSAHKRLNNNLLLTFNFESLNDIFFEKSGIILDVEFMKNINPQSIRSFGDSFSITPIRTPNARLLNSNRPSDDGSFDASKNLTTEGLALQQVLSFSFTLSIPEDDVRFITQSPKTEKVSLLALHNWITLWSRRFVRPKGGRIKGGPVKRNEMPSFILPISKTTQVTETRKKNGYAVERGKGDDNNIYIGSNGGLHYGLPSDQRADIADNLNGYDATMESYIDFCFSHNIPLQSTVSLPNQTLLAIGEGNNANEKYGEIQKSVRGYSGKILSYDWDYNVVITANIADPSNMVADRIIGAAKLDTMTLADYLGYNFADSGKPAIKKTFADSMALMLNLPIDNDTTPAKVIGRTDYIDQEGGPVSRLLKFHTALYQANIVRSPAELCKAAASELGITAMESAPFMQKDIYASLISNDLIVHDTYPNIMAALLAQVARHCMGGNTFIRMLESEHEGTSFADLRDMVPEHEHYFKPDVSPMVDFGHLYNYIGGMMFKLACEDILKVPHKTLFGSIPNDKSSYEAVSRFLLPQAVMFAKYVPTGEKILEAAEIVADTNKPDTSITEQDIKVSGSIAGAQLFPHQVTTHQSLRKRPAFAVLDIGAGGGKTTLGVTDIAAMTTELAELGERVKPLIICPDGLVRNWVDDMKIHTGTNWNMIPITTKTIDRWGYDKLEELITNAPVNTVCVIGYNMLTARSENIVFGSTQVRVSNNLEFIKRFGFDYICIDESHKLANKSSQRHRAVKQLTTWSGIKYFRLATGTLIHGRINDIIGQASLYNGHIFREDDVLSAKENEVVVNGEAIPLWKVDTPSRARAKLSRYASVITMKKKNWAFMLPRPIENFYPIPLVPDMRPGNGVTEEEVKLGELHRQLYDTVLYDSIEKLEALVKSAKKRKEDADEDDEDENDGETDGENGDDTGDLDTEDEDLSGLSSADLKPFIARLERLITNPMADPLAPSIFGLAGIKHYNSSVASFVARHINKHFNVPDWSRDTNYKEDALVQHKGIQFLAKKVDKGVAKVNLPESTVGIEPQNNPDYWREEPQGKIIIFCRYTNSVGGIYDALSPDLQKIAVKFTGQEDDKWANLDAFKADPKVQILIANEMGISEGHNLQMASRIIRVESPWNPGDLDQSASRIFRPDPAAAKAMVESGKAGSLYREVIFLDWILCDGTLHIQKQARLIAKVFNKARFDEAENPLYKDALDHYQLDEVPMSLEILRSRSTLEQYSTYVNAYGALNGVMHKEFKEMRDTMEPRMRDIPVTPAVAGSAKVNTPFVSNQKPDDSEGLGLLSLRQLLRHADIIKDPTTLIGSPILSDLGKGRIAKLNYRYRYKAKLDDEGQPIKDAKGKVVTELDLDAFGNRQLDDRNPVSSVTIKLVDGNVISINDPGLLFSPQTLNAKTAKQFQVDSLAVTEAQQRKLDREAEKERNAKEALEEKELIEEAKRRRKERKDLDERHSAYEDGQKRKKNIEAGKPINDGVKRMPKLPKTVPDTSAMSISIHPAYFQGFLTLEVLSDDEDAPALTKFGFKHTGPYVYVRATKYAQYEKILDYIDANFKYSDVSAKRLELIQEAFETGGKEIYRLELAPQSSLPHFFSVRKQKVTVRNEIRPYPIILPDELQIAVDLATCPVIKKHIGKSIPGAATKWTLSDGHELYFAHDKTAMRDKIKELEAAGFTIENREDTLAEITAIKFRAPKSTKQPTATKK